MQPVPAKASRGASHEASLAIERFLSASRKPVLMEPGEDTLPITPATFVVTCRGANASPDTNPPLHFECRLECWDNTRSLSRRVTRVKLERPGRLELEVERFGYSPSRLRGSRFGTLTLADLARASNHHVERKCERLKYRERFRESLQRQFPEWRVVEVSCEQDLQHSFSPVFPRALIRKGSGKGTTALAAIGVPEDYPAPEAALSFGLIWLDYLRDRESREHAERRTSSSHIDGLALFVPAGFESALCHRVRFLNPKLASYLVFVYDGITFEQQINPHDYTNLDTRLDTPLRSQHPVTGGLFARQATSFSPQTLDSEVPNAALAVSSDKRHSLFKQGPFAKGPLTKTRSFRPPSARFTAPNAEAVLESRVRANIEQIDASLLPDPVYGQVPQFAGGDRGLMDLLAVDRGGRLAVVELKVDQDIHLPLQALDYWMRVKWFLDRGEFVKRGYFPGIPLGSEPPRLLLVAPAMEFHPSNEIVIRYFDPQIPVERLGIGIEWRRELKVVFRPPPAGAEEAARDGIDLREA